MAERETAAAPVLEIQDHGVANICLLSQAVDHLAQPEKIVCHQCRDAAEGEDGHQTEPVVPRRSQDGRLLNHEDGGDQDGKDHCNQQDDVKGETSLQAQLPAAFPERSKPAHGSPASADLDVDELVLREAVEV